jgi:hypothetical protein
MRRTLHAVPNATEMDVVVVISATAAAYDASGGGGTISARGRRAAL